MKMPLLMTLSFCLIACAPATSTADASRSFESTSASTLAPASIRLPERFIGRWDASLEACKATSDMKLIITQTELTFWESIGRIRAVVVKAPDDVTVQADFSGEGEQWQRRLHLVLSKDGQTLTVDGGGIRIRCP
jgi:hypothetical protein